jgi:DNA-binding beta-propeller fold protein YncE
VRPDRIEAYTAAPAAATLAADDDDPWAGLPALRATAATQVTHALPAPADCSRARKLLVAVQSNPAGAPLTVTLLDDAAPPAALNLAGAVATPAGAWRVLSFALPQAGAFNWSAVTAVRYSALDPTATYLFGAILLEADPTLDLVIMGGDGTSAGAGRFYGDGLAAVKEAHGTYFTQADLPQADPAALAPVATGNRRIDWAYLDLWERPITYVERPALRDVALDGADTCTRRQLVAQVRLLKGAEVPFADTAAPPTAAFDALPRLGRGFLSTKDKPAAVLDPCADPCEPAIAGPYLGEDNRLFRVEIHRGGDIGPAGAPTTAHFKWSRHNGAVTSNLIADAQAGDFSVQVEKPERYAVGDLIEIADDPVDLATGLYEDRVNHRRHRRGELRRIVTVNLATRRLSWQDPAIVDPAEAPFHTALPHAMRLADHAKVTQWDGVAAVTAGDIVLADGVVIEFGGSDLVAGDYWQFATRTADRSVERLIEAPPHGTGHAFYPLAAIRRARQNAASAEVVFAEDLRPRFVALPSLDASRVAFDPGACLAEHSVPGFTGVKTVQQAIDALCRADLTGDLKLHNQLLHGMGVICGLKLRCANDRRRVTLTGGYALDCDGTLLHQAGDRSVALLDMAEAQGLLNPAGDGFVNLWVEPGAGGLQVQIEGDTPQPFWQSVLEGTLLLDFWNKAVLALFNFLKAQLQPFPAPAPPLPDSHQRAVSLINLLWQIVNSATGPYIFVSKREHDRLEQFHRDLQAQLASKTYCGLFDTLTPFPAYPYAVPPGIDTFFGLVLGHSRLKLAPGDRYLVAYGSGNKIQVFDTTADNLVAATVFPGAVNLQVRDVAFNPTGTELYAVGTIDGGGKFDSVFATATLTPPAGGATAPTLTWGPASMVCDVEFVTLATHPAQPNRLFAIGRSPDPNRQGVYRFVLPTIPLVPSPWIKFNATGLFAIDTGGVRAVAADQSNVANLTGAFDRLRQLDLNTQASSTPPAFAITGTDFQHDLAIANGAVYITGNVAGGSALFRFTLAPQAAQPPIPLGPGSFWRLALLPTSQRVLIAETNASRARVFNTATGTLFSTLRVPLQIMPASLAARPDEARVFALNFPFGTVNAIDLPTLLAAPPTFMAEPPVTLAAYRAKMLAAFADLASVLGQYFKDAWCDLFLVECPECTERDRIYLGTIEIKTHQVLNLANFSKRRYAKSFRTWGYWLSAVPILPLAKRLFAKLASEMLVP